MGSMIHLAVGRLEIDWGKNNFFTDHSPLFQTDDVEFVPYYYADDTGEKGEKEEGKDWSVFREDREGLSKPLHEVIDRVNLLGHTLKVSRNEFEYLSIQNDFVTDKLSFEQLAEALKQVDVKTLSADYGDAEAFEKFFRRQIFPRLGLDKIVDDSFYSAHDAALGMENLSPYTILQLFAFNPAVANLPVRWAYADVMEGGWAKQSQFLKALDPTNKILIVTEGSSDGLILKQAFSLLKPHIADFFYYVDMEEGYPFSGTGNLKNFVKGLISISVQNNTLVLFDNDVEGVASFNKCQELNIPSNMRILKLPDLKEFESFSTVGPSGQYSDDINGKAASIECYLDLKSKGEVRWNNYNSTLRRYQGELIAKDGYKKDFLNQKEKQGDYSYKKIQTVLDMIIDSSIEMREAEAIKQFEDNAMPLDDDL